MNRKLEDRMIELAFGDLTPEEARQLEARAATDPAVSGTLQAYRDLRDGLRHLGEIPEHQLSNDRLRDAILTRGLAEQKEKPAPTPWWTWAWMPAAACGLAFVAVLARNATQPTATHPQLVMASSPSNQIVAQNDDWTPKFEEYARPLDFGSTAVETNPAPDTQVVAARSKLSSKPSIRHGIRHGQGSASGRFATRGEHARVTPNPIILTAKEIPPVVETLPKAAAVTEDQPIVLIAAEKDAETGAQVATEVQSANVLVGG